MRQGRSPSVSQILGLATSASRAPSVREECAPFLVELFGAAIQTRAGGFSRLDDPISQ